VRLHGGDRRDGASRLTPTEDMALVRELLKELTDGGTGTLRIYRPQPTAAFSPRDTTLPNYAIAASHLQSLGFAPVERRAGGQLAIYDGNALVVDLVAHHPDPRQHVMERYVLFSRALAAALALLPIDARVGPVPGEYCPGDYSVNWSGRMKLAGVAQRIAKGSFHMGAVISVLRSEPVRAAVASAYGILGIPFDPATFGSIGEIRPGTTMAGVRDCILAAVSGQLLVCPQGE
jgi:octanoyl-[GcvH]:protein N-octanoyltransferase